MLTSNISTTDCRYGRLAFFEDDEFIGKSLLKYGEYSDLETDLWCLLELEDKTVIDVGANIGALTVALVDIVGAEGHVIAFEPQPQNAGLLRRNVSCLNVTVEEVALAAAPGAIRVPYLFDLGHKNYGRVELGSGEAVVDVKTLDSYRLSPAFIKIDVEGFESEVLLGARATIERHQPLLYVENDREEKAAELTELIEELGYVCYWHTPPLFNPGNWRHEEKNIFGNIVSMNMLCVPSKQKEKWQFVTEELQPVNIQAQLSSKFVPSSAPAVITSAAAKWAGIARLGGIGDNLIASSVLRPLKKQGYKIEFIAQRPHHEVLLNNPFIDKLTVKNAGDIPNGDDWQKWFAARGKEYDHFINLSHSCEGLLAPFYAMTSWHWPAEFRRKQFGGSYIETVHDIVGVDHDFGPLFFPTEEEKAKAQDTKHKLAIGGRPLVGWIIRGTRIDKLYPQAPTAIARLIKELDVAVLAFGAPRPSPDMDLAYQIQEHVTAQNGSSDNYFLAITNPARGAEWPVRRSLTMLQQCDLVIGPDTGPLWSVGFEPMAKIVLHSHASPENIAKHWLHTTSLHADPKRVICFPCHRLHDSVDTCVANKDNSGAACISDISVEDIVRAAKMRIR